MAIYIPIFSPHVTIYGRYPWIARIFSISRIVAKLTQLSLTLKRLVDQLNTPPVVICTHMWCFAWFGTICEICNCWSLKITFSPWVFFMFSKLYKLRQIVQRVSRFYYFCFSHLESLKSKQVISFYFFQTLFISVEWKHGAANDCITIFYPWIYNYHNIY